MIIEMEIANIEQHNEWKTKESYWYISVNRNLTKLL